MILDINLLQQDTAHLFHAWHQGRHEIDQTSPSAKTVAINLGHKSLQKCYSDNHVGPFYVTFCDHCRPDSSLQVTYL